MKDNAKRAPRGSRICKNKSRQKTPWLAKGKEAITVMWNKNMAERMEEACNDSGLTLSDTF